MNGWTKITRSGKIYFFLNHSSCSGVDKFFSVKGQIINIFRFVGHMVFVILLNSAIVAWKQPWTIQKWWVWLYFNETFRKTGSGQIWPLGWSRSLVPGLWCASEWPEWFVAGKDALTPGSGSMGVGSGLIPMVVLMHQSLMHLFSFP